MVILHPPHSPNPTDCILLYCTIPPRYVYPSTPARHLTPTCTHTHHIAIHITLTHRPCCTPSLTMCTHPTRLAISHPHAHPHITSHPLAVAALLLLMLPLHMLCCYCCRCRRCTATAAVAALLLIMLPLPSPSLQCNRYYYRCRRCTATADATTTYAVLLLLPLPSLHCYCWCYHYICFSLLHDAMEKVSNKRMEK